MRTGRVSFRCHPRRFSPNEAAPRSIPGRGRAPPGLRTHLGRGSGSGSPPAASAPRTPSGASGSLFQPQFVFKSSPQSSAELYTLAAARGGFDPVGAFGGKAWKNLWDFAELRDIKIIQSNFYFIFFPNFPHLSRCLSAFLWSGPAIPEPSWGAGVPEWDTHTKFARALRDGTAGVPHTSEMSLFPLLCFLLLFAPSAFRRPSKPRF